MMATPSIRRLSIAITAAVGSLTLAIGATTASLLGWFAPPRSAGSEPPPLDTPVPPSANPSVDIVPEQETVTPTATAPAGEIVVSPDDITLAMHDDEYEHHEHERHHDRDGHDDHDEDSDD